MRIILSVSKEDRTKKENEERFEKLREELKEKRFWFQEYLSCRLGVEEKSFEIYIRTEDGLKFCREVAEREEQEEILLILSKRFVYKMKRGDDFVKAEWVGWWSRIGDGSGIGNNWTKVKENYYMIREFGAVEAGTVGRVEAGMEVVKGNDFL